MDWIPEVALDEEGLFKYILIKLVDTTTEEVRFIVRGHGGDRFEYHNDIFRATRDAISGDPRGANVRAVCVGGGRIQHKPGAKPACYVYGYSQAFGRADHARTCDLIRKAYPHYGEEGVVWSNEGY